MGFLCVFVKRRNVPLLDACDACDAVYIGVSYEIIEKIVEILYRVVG
jgi:hypothetical protein